MEGRLVQLWEPERSALAGQEILREAMRQVY